MERVRLFKFNGHYYNFTDPKSRVKYLKEADDSEGPIEIEYIRKLKYQGKLYDTQSEEFKSLCAKLGGYNF